MPKIKIFPGHVNHDVFFSLDVCSSSFHPRRWDPVRYFAVECSPTAYNGDCAWRAVRVVPRRDHIRPAVATPAEQQHEDAKFEELLRPKNGVAVEKEDDEKLQLSLGEAAKISVRIRSDGGGGVRLVKVGCLGERKRREEEEERGEEAMGINKVEVDKRVVTLPLEVRDKQ